MAALIDKVKKHPVISWVLSLIPVMGITFGLTNWVMTRQNEKWRLIAEAKDVEIQRLQDNVLQRQVSPAPTGATIHAEGDGSPAIGSVGRDVIINATQKPKEGCFINNPQYGSTLLKKEPNLEKLARDDYYGSLGKGTQVEILESSQDPAIGHTKWNKVKVLDGPLKDKIGWVSANTIEKR